MKAFIIYSELDSDWVRKLSKELEKHPDISLVKAKQTYRNAVEEIHSILEKSDYVIVVLSKTSVKSKKINEQLSIILNHEVEKKEIIAVPVSFENCEIPFSLQNRTNIDFRISFDEGVSKLIKTLSEKSKEQYKKQYEDKSEKINLNSYETQLKNLQEAYELGNLSLFCGAGISYDAGIPTWNTLLKSLLKEATSIKTIDILDIDSKLADIFQKKINLSPLIVAQYLKNILEDQFIETLRRVLYKTCTGTSPIIEEIVELSRPAREKKPLKAIITFNFDDLIESNLAKQRIKFKSIFREGERCRNDEIPIYHPHGFISQNVHSGEAQVVFSEDAYHTQFIDSFSWSNLVQLHHLADSVCLFIGISLTDPNMRRLIDVSMRKRGRDDINHYIIKKKYELSDLYFEPEKLDKDIPRILENIEEQDAKKLGFNVIWINDFNEIPEILKKIRE
jgi:hypothetical protein